MAKSKAKKKSKSKKINKWKRGVDASRGVGEYFRIKDKITYVLLAEANYSEGVHHWLETPGRATKINCKANGLEEPPTKAKRASICKLCELEDELEMNSPHRYYFNVFLGTVKEIKGKKWIIFKSEVVVFEAPKTVGGAICAYGDEIEDDQDGEWEEEGIDDITKLVFKVKRIGEGKNASYEVRAMSKVKFKIKGDVSYEFADLEHIVKPDSDKKIKEALVKIGYEDDIDEDEDYEEEFSDEDDWDEEESIKKSKKNKSSKKKSKKNKSSKKKSKKKKDEEDDWDDEDWDDEDEEDDWDD